MAPSGPDASNSCIPPEYPVKTSTPPLPGTNRGDRLDLGVVSKTQSLTYPSGKTVVVRSLPNAENASTLVYRGHHNKTTACRASPSGAYMVSGDERGNVRVWALDTEEHLPKYVANTCLSGAISDLAWDGESKRIALCGERSGSGGESAKCIMYDTGNTVGQLGQHLKGRISAIAFKQQRPMRIATTGKDDGKLNFHKGPPFAKVPAQDGIPCETAHTKGLHCVRYSKDGALVASAGSDRTIAIYDGKTLELKHTSAQVHSATIYSVAWGPDDRSILTASGDGTCKLFRVNETDGTLTEEKTWTPAEHQLGASYERVPVGGNQVGAVYCGDTPVSVGLNGQLTVLGDTYQVLTGHNAPIARLAVGNGVFYTGDTDGIMCEWELATATPTKRVVYHDNKDLMYVTHTGAISGMSCCKASGALHSVGWDDTLRLKQGNHELAAQPVCMASGKEVSVVCTVQGLQVFREKDQSLSDLLPTTYEALSVCVSADDSAVYVGGNDCNIHVYSLMGEQLEEAHVMEGGHLKPVHALQLSHDGTKLAAGDDRDVLVWDVANKYASLIGKGRWCFHVQKVTCLAWSSDDQVLASGGADDSIYLWSLQKKSTRVHYKYAHRGGVTGLTFTNGYQMISAGVDAAVNLWDVTDDVAKKFG